MTIKNLQLTMLLHIRLLMKSLSAVAAWIRPRVGMNQEMSRQSAASLEGLSTLLALLGEEN